MDFVIDKDTRIYNINISNKCEFSYFDEHVNYLTWRNNNKVGIYITINNIVTTFIPFHSKKNMEYPQCKGNFERFLNGKNINYLNNNYSLEKNIFEMTTINEILNMDIKIKNIDDLTEVYNKMVLLGYIKILYTYIHDSRGITKTDDINTFYYTELFINKIINYYSTHNIIKVKYNIDFNFINNTYKYYENHNGGISAKTDDLNHNINIITVQSKVIKKIYKLYDSIEEFIKDKKIDKKYKIQQLEPLLIEELQDYNPEINLLVFKTEDKQIVHDIQTLIELL